MCTIKLENSFASEEINDTSTESHDFCYGSSLNAKQKKILEQVEKSPYPITPSEICDNTELNSSTVRNYLRLLEKRSLVKRKFHGHYETMRNITTFGRRVVEGLCEQLPRVHSLRFRVFHPGVSARRWVKDLGVVRLDFAVYKNGSATVFVNCDKDASLGYVAFRMVVSEVLASLDVTEDQVVVSSCEFNNDFEGVQLDGVQAVTLKSFDGSFRRLYNHGSVLRDEVKTVGSKTVDDVLALMVGGVSQYNMMQALYMNLQQNKQRVETVKFNNRKTSETVSLMKRFVDAVMKKNAEKDES